MRQRPRVAAAAGILGALLVLVIVVLLTRTPSKPVADPTLSDPTISARPTLKPLKELPTVAATPTTAAQAAQALKKQLDSLGNAGGGGSGNLGNSTIPGLPGGTAYKYATKHRISIRVTSAEPIGTIGYYIPYSPDHQSGTVLKAGTSWSLRTVSYGDPDYARIYVSSGPNPAHPVTVSITIDGVTHSKSTEGPYALLIYQQ